MLLVRMLRNRRRVGCNVLLQDRLSPVFVVINGARLTTWEGVHMARDMLQVAGVSPGNESSTSRSCSTVLRIELHPPALQFVQHVQEIPHAAPQPVELPHRQGVARLQGLEAARQGRTLGDGSAQPLVGKRPAVASGRLQRGELHRRVLPVLADMSEPYFMPTL